MNCKIISTAGIRPNSIHCYYTKIINTINTVRKNVDFIIASRDNRDDTPPTTKKTSISGEFLLSHTTISSSQKHYSLSLQNSQS
ncbi:MAG: hypothetical protein IM568_06135 [Flavobacterium sp.]|nr:hypothetical protein [Flavobacterium sp.]